MTTPQNDMTARDLHDEIAQIEADIEQFADLLERCRKAMVFSKVAIGAGAILILAYVLGATRFEPMAMVGGIAAVIGGVVIYGSNSGTSKKAAAAMKNAEALRARLIDKLDPPSVAVI